MTKHFIAAIAIALCLCNAIAATAQPKETKLNTASFTTPDGKVFKLTLIGDTFPRFFVNGEKISKHDFDLYEEQFEHLRMEIEQQQKLEQDRQHARRDRIHKQILSDIVAKKLVTGATEIKSYYLTPQNFSLNGTVQPPGVFQFFKERYVKSNDTVYYFEPGHLYARED